VLAHEVALEGPEGEFVHQCSAARPPSSHTSALTHPAARLAGCSLSRLWDVLGPAVGRPLDDAAKRFAWAYVFGLAHAGELHLRYREASTTQDRRARLLSALLARLCHSLT